MIGRDLTALVATLAALVAGGCGAAVLTRLDARALDHSAEATFTLGSTRAAVEQAIGRSESTVQLADGSTVATYTYPSATRNGGR